MDSCVSFLVLAGLVAAVIYLARLARRQERKVESLEARLERLENRHLDPVAVSSSEAAERSVTAAEVADETPPAAPAPAPSAVISEPPPPAVDRLRPAAREAASQGETPHSKHDSATPGDEEKPATDHPPAGPDAGDDAGQQRGWPSVEWERFIGVRGFAVLGGAVLALAALLFVKEIADRGYFPPAVRVTLAFLAGIGAIAGGEMLRPRGYRATADALAGSGVIILYAATWAAARLFALIPFAFAFALMALVTAAAGLLAWRHRSQVIAGLGLVGGFATPLLLETGFDRPLGLFGYLLLLNAAAVSLLRRRGWPLLGGFSLITTIIYLASWIFFHLDADDGLLALALLGLFAAIFGFAGLGRSRPGGDLTDDRSALRAISLLMPFGGAAYLASRADLGDHLLPIASLLFLVTLAVGLLEQARILEPGITATAAAATVAVIAVWAWGHDFDLALAFECAGLTVGLAALHLALFQRDRQHHERSGPPRELAVAVIAGGLLALLVLVASFHPLPVWPWLGAWLGLGAILLRVAAVCDKPWIAGGSATLVASGLMIFFAAQHSSAQTDSPHTDAGFFALVVGIATLLQAIAVLRRGQPASRAFEAAALAYAMVVILWLIPLAIAPVAPAVFLATLALAALLATLSVTPSARGKHYLALVLAVSAALVVWDTGYRQGSTLAFTGQLLLVAAMSLWPFTLGRTLARSRWAVYGAALAGPLAFLPLRERFVTLFGDRAIGVLPLGLAALALIAAQAGRRLLAKPGDRGETQGTETLVRSQVWLLAASLGFVALAVPLQLSREWWTIAWALQGAAMLALWRRFDHPGLKYFGIVLLTAATLRLIANPGILIYHPTGPWPIVNWLLYTYWLPAAALIVSGRLLQDLEIGRARHFEDGLYRAGKPFFALGCGLATVVVVFCWVNLTVFDAFATGPHLAISLERLPARDLALSLAWALYALTLLAIALRRAVVGLRWISLAVLVLTISKVFLYDLGHLAGLYRVGSLVGLAISLLLVSLVYQRFVFDRRSSDE